MQAIFNKNIFSGVFHKVAVIMRRALRYFLHLSSSLAGFTFFLLLISDWQNFSDPSVKFLYHCLRISLMSILFFLPLLLLFRITITHRTKKTFKRVLATLLWMLTVFFLINVLEFFYTFTRYGKFTFSTGVGQWLT
ncbi:MAG: hypothetical protein ACRCVN_05395 [Spirochaetia bacterium]